MQVWWWLNIAQMLHLFLFSFFFFSQKVLIHQDVSLLMEKNVWFLIFPSGSRTVFLEKKTCTLKKQRGRSLLSDGKWFSVPCCSLCFRAGIWTCKLTLRRWASASLQVFLCHACKHSQLQNRLLKAVSAAWQLQHLSQTCEEQTWASRYCCGGN